MNSCIIRYLVCAVCAAILIVQWGCSPEKSGEHRREAQTLAANVHQRVCTAKEKIDRGRLNDAFVLNRHVEASERAHQCTECHMAAVKACFLGLFHKHV